VIFQHLQVWLDPVQRPGPEAMAVDEWLLETAEAPVLRVYQWHGEWATLGYFGALAPARNSLPGVSWVRRWTGGGVVDHRADWTYTVVAPSGEALAAWRGAESYRRIHEALVAALRDEPCGVRLSAGEAQTGAAMCFDNPVSHDLVAGDGRKLAGAGQRRTRHGLLHQGAVALACRGAESRQRATSLAAGLAAAWELREFEVPQAHISRLVRDRYANAAWTCRR
jgi:lipoyl(octanoyl) transferase